MKVLTVGVLMEALANVPPNEPVLVDMDLVIIGGQMSARKKNLFHIIEPVTHESEGLILNACYAEIGE